MYEWDKSWRVVENILKMKHTEQAMINGLVKHLKT
jgi:hypothetical protein